MKTFWIFNTNAEYDEGSLEAHLNYLRNYNGTPSGNRGDGIEDAVEFAKKVAPAVITDDDYNVIDRVTGE